MHVQKIKRQINHKMNEKHRESYQNVGAPPSKSWSLSKSTPRTQQVEFTIKTQKRSSGIIYQCKKSKQRKNEFVSNTLALLLGSQYFDHPSGIYNVYIPSGRPQEVQTTSKIREFH
jgi:hypothetical protein